MKIFVLGAGMMGRAVVYDLGRVREVKAIAVADFDRDRAQEVARTFGQGKTRAHFADVRDTRHLAKLAHGYDVLLNCTQYNWNLEVMRAALAARINYMDLGGLYHMTRQQFALDKDFRRIRRMAIPGMGGAPGITNVMARALADPLERVDGIRVYNAGADEQHYDSPIAYTFSIATILDELTMPPIAFERGRYVEKPMLSDPEVGKFRAPIGSVTLRHSIHSELGTLAESFRHKGVKDVFFKINYDPRLVNLIRDLDQAGFTSREPVAVNGTRVAPRAVLLSLMQQRAPKKTARDVEALRVVVSGTQQESPGRLRHGNVGGLFHAPAAFGCRSRYGIPGGDCCCDARGRRNSRHWRAGAGKCGASAAIFQRAEETRIHVPTWKLNLKLI